MVSKTEEECHVTEVCVVVELQLLRKKNDAFGYRNKETLSAEILFLSQSFSGQWCHLPAIADKSIFFVSPRLPVQLWTELTREPQRMREEFPVSNPPKSHKAKHRKGFGSEVL